MNNPVTSVYSTNLFHGTTGLLLAQSSGILLILHYRFQQVHTCNIKQIQFTIKVQRAAVCRLQNMSVLVQWEKLLRVVHPSLSGRGVWACARCFSAGICQRVCNG